MNYYSSTTVNNVHKKYNEEQKVLSCTFCTLFFDIENCIIHTTPKGKKYPICPVCKRKTQLRSRARCKRWFRNRIDYKRI